MGFLPQSRGDQLHTGVQLDPHEANVPASGGGGGPRSGVGQKVEPRMATFKLEDLPKASLVHLEGSICPVVKGINDSDSLQLEEPAVSWMAKLPLEHRSHCA